MGLGMGEVIFGVIGVILPAFYFLAKYLTVIGGKACPHCAEKIRKDAIVCRYCHLDVTGDQTDKENHGVFFQ